MDDASVREPSLCSTVSTNEAEEYFVVDKERDDSSGNSSSGVLNVENGSDNLEMNLSDAVNELPTNERPEHDSQASTVDVMDMIAGDTSDVNVDSTYLHGVTYLGCGFIEDCQSTLLALDVMLKLKREGMSAIPVTLVIPSSSHGDLKLLVPGTDEVKYRALVPHIACCTRGNTSETHDCIAYVVRQSSRSDNYLCHVVQFAALETCAAAINCFGQAFDLPSARLGGSPLSVELGSEAVMLVQMSIDIKEDNNSSNNYVSIARDKSCFKFRQQLIKKVELGLKPVSDPCLPVERVCGLFMQIEDSVSDGDGHYELLDYIDTEDNVTEQQRQVVGVGRLDPNLPQFSAFNQLTGKAGFISTRLALDVVFAGIQSPVRFHARVQVRVFPRSERFFYPSRKPVVENFVLNLKQCEDGHLYRVDSVRGGGSEHPVDEFGLHLNHDAFAECEANIEETSDLDDSFLMSGYGNVSKDCSEDVLREWDNVLSDWRCDSEQQRPKNLRNLVRTLGVPEALRGEVWQRLVGTEDAEDLCVKYRQYLDQECVTEDQIIRDISRTFPANEFFKDDQGPGQEALLKLTKAYSQHDQEIGYCQGLTYVAAVLLLHMPEEQAFCVFVRLMGLYRLRELYKQDFYELKLKWHQLDRLTKDNLPALYYHFDSIGLKSHMFSSQWFLTMYTAKFPLYLVYRIYDIIFTEGLNFLLNVALALLKASAEELQRLSFEDCNTFLKASIPRKYRSEAAADQLIQDALTLKISSKKLAFYAKEYYDSVKTEELQRDPLERLKLEQQENHKKIMSLEAEALHLADQLVSSKLDSQRKLDDMEEKLMEMQKMFESNHQELADLQEENSVFQTDLDRVKELLRAASVELDSSRRETELQKEIVSEYRKTCTRLERERDAERALLSSVRQQICDDCKCKVDAAVVASGDPACSLNKTPVTDRETEFIAMEQELALTKLKLVEEQANNQSLEHELSELRQSLPSPGGGIGSGFLQKTSNFFRIPTPTGSASVSRSNSSVSAQLPHV